MQTDKQWGKGGKNKKEIGMGVLDVESVLQQRGKNVKDKKCARATAIKMTLVRRALERLFR